MTVQLANVSITELFLRVKDAYRHVFFQIKAEV